MSEAPKRHWLNFSLRTLFVVLTVAGVMVAGTIQLLNGFRERQRERQMDRDFPELMKLIRETVPPQQVPEILRKKKTDQNSFLESEATVQED